MSKSSRLLSLVGPGLLLAGLSLSLMSVGCKAPGKPGPEPEVGRPEELVAFTPLYQQNCAGCHGSQGQHGAAISLANPAYLGFSGVANIDHITSNGVAGTAMPPFSKAAGGMLTDQQIHIIAQGMVDAWGKPDALAGATMPAYSNNSVGDAAQGQKTFTVFCARCHGADATGNAARSATHLGSLVDPAYLALVSNQSLRSTIIAGLPNRDTPDEDMPDWRSDVAGRPMTDQEITDTVTWLASYRMATPGQPYQNLSAVSPKEASGDPHE